MTDGTQALLDKARRYLHSAKVLQQEGDYDSAASRLYYAMFYFVEGLLWNHGISRSSHQGVISAFAAEFCKTNRLPSEMHRWLLDAFHMRHEGDYRAPSAVRERDVVDLQIKAQEFLRRTESFLIACVPPAQDTATDRLPAFPRCDATKKEDKGE